MSGDFRGPTWTDWAMLALSLLFVASGFLVFRSEPANGIVVIAFFGACSLVFLSRIRRKRRWRRPRPDLVEVVGGVPIRPSRRRAALLGGSIAVLGTVLLAFGGGFGALLQALGGLIALAGYLLVAGAALGKIPAGYLQFDPEGLSVDAARWAYFVPWDAIAGVVLATHQDNPILLIWLHEGAEVIATPADRAEAVRRHLARNQQAYGAPVALNAAPYTVDPAVLCQAIERYVQDPVARAGLTRDLLPHGS